MVDELKYFFDPQSIVVIGASSRPMSPGNIIFDNLIRNQEKGVLRARIYGVNIKGGEWRGHKFYKSVLDIDDKLDHAVIVVPAKFVPKVVNDCGEKGVKALTIVSSGFSEVGQIELEREILRIARKYGMRVIGPNGLGIYDPYTGIDTLFIPQAKEVNGKLMINLPRPKKGHIAFLSQSGALGGVVLDYLWGEGLGISKFVSWGNKIDVDEADMLKYLAADKNTRVVALYIESLKKNAREFVKIARKFTKTKPIIALKGGVTEAGARAAMSHTASLSGEYKVYYGAFKQSGIIISEGILDMVDKARALVMQPPARGNKVAIISNGGGPGIVLTDALERKGLIVPKFENEVIRELRKLVSEGTIPEIASIQNPIDLSGTATDDSYVETIRVVMESKNIDVMAILLLHHPPTLSSRLPEKVLNIIKDSRKPTLLLDIGLGEMSLWVRRKFNENGIPAYSMPERLASGLQALVDYGKWLKRNNSLDRYLELWFSIR